MHQIINLGIKNQFSLQNSCQKSNSYRNGGPRRQTSAPKMEGKPAKNL